MKPDPRIADMRRRIQRWLRNGAAGHNHSDDGDSIDALDADLAALESQLNVLLPAGDLDVSRPEVLREQSVLRTVLDTMVEGVLVVDMQGQFLVFNTTARNLLGRGPGDTRPADWSQEYGIFRADGESLCPTEELPLMRALGGALVDDEELVIRTPAHPADCHVSATGRPLRGDDGSQIGAVVVFHDITATKKVERELRRARASAEANDRAKSEFLANMSHEIRTPLTAVLGFADLLMDPKLDDSSKLNYTQAIRRNGEHLLSLINDVLDLSKINANQLQIESVGCSLHSVIHDVTSTMQTRAYDKGLTFEIEYETPIPAHIETDPMRVRQILLNLLSNAIKFTQQGGVKLSARCLDSGTDSARVEIAVTDTGIGLSAAEIDDLFQAFQQANPSTSRRFGGTGLGLTICRSLAEALGGDITVASTPGHGSTFTFTLYQPNDPHGEMVDEPGAMTSELEADGSERKPSQELKGRVLLAEDGVDNQLLISTILRRQGLEVVIAEDGEAAVDQVLAGFTNNTFFDLILMDMQMPRLDGYGATAKLRIKGYSGPIVALTAHAMPGERERCMAAGCDDYISKPIDRPLLLATVESHLHRVRGGRPASATTDPSTIPAEPVDDSSPLYSAYADDPEMEELVADFVTGLPSRIHDIRSAADAGDLERIRRLAHQIKGAAGGYGFMPVSREAEALEAVARDATETAEAGEAIDRLAALCNRVSHGRPAD